PLPAPALAQAGVEPRLQPDPLADYLRRLACARQVAGPQRGDRRVERGDPLRELARLSAAGVVERRVALALEAQRRHVVVGLAVAGEQQHQPCGSGPATTVSARSPSRSVSSDSTSRGAMLPRLTSWPKR